MDSRSDRIYWSSLLSLNQRLSQPLVSRQVPTAPGIPPYYPHGEKLITSDVIGE